MTVPPERPAEERTPPLDFDPYRFGKPEHPVPPEYAPPGYYPEAPAEPDRPAGAVPPGARVPPPPLPSGSWKPGPYPPPPPAYRYGTNSKATAALVLGILSILLAWLTLWDLLLIVPAIVLGIRARRDAARFPERAGRATATAGLICGIVAAVLALLIGVYIYNRVQPCLDQYDMSSNQFRHCATDRLLGR